jgi:glycosyltransferase involved in cell wall biosynthesis
MRTATVVVITVTRGRPLLLRRATESLLNQDWTGDLLHLIVVDACEPTVEEARQLSESSPGCIEWISVPRIEEQTFGPSHLARLRNLAVRLVDSKWVAFLDDDNRWAPDHLRTLVDCAAWTGCPAVHSHRYLLHRDGSPYLEQRMPWKRDAAQGVRLYDELCQKGIFEPGSNVVRDRAQKNDSHDTAQMVDMGEWLFSRPLLLEHPFEETYTYEDWVNVIPEDNKLLQRLVRHGVPTATTGRPTLYYYLGGYSNAFNEDSATSCVWTP